MYNPISGSGVTSGRIAGSTPSTRYCAANVVAGVVPRPETESPPSAMPTAHVTATAAARIVPHTVLIFSPVATLVILSFHYLSRRICRASQTPPSRPSPPKSTSPLPCSSSFPVLLLWRNATNHIKETPAASMLSTSLGPSILFIPGLHLPAAPSRAASRISL